MRVKCDFIIFLGEVFLYDVQTKMVIASGIENNVSLRHTYFPEGNLVRIYIWYIYMVYIHVPLRGKTAVLLEQTERAQQRGPNPRPTCIKYSYCKARENGIPDGSNN